MKTSKGLMTFRVAGRSWLMESRTKTKDPWRPSKDQPKERRGILKGEEGIGKEGERKGGERTPQTAHAPSGLDDRDNQDGRLEARALPWYRILGLMILIITLPVLVVAREWQGQDAA